MTHSPSHRAKTCITKLKLHRTEHIFTQRGRCCLHTCIKDQENKRVRKTVTRSNADISSKRLFGDTMGAGGAQLLQIERLTRRRGAFYF